jgi:hypothetical protein
MSVYQRSVLKYFNPLELPSASAFSIAQQIENAGFSIDAHSPLTKNAWEEVARLSSATADIDSESIANDILKDQEGTPATNCVLLNTSGYVHPDGVFGCERRSSLLSLFGVDSSKFFEGFENPNPRVFYASVKSSEPLMRATRRVVTFKSGGELFGLYSKTFQDLGVDPSLGARDTCLPFAESLFVAKKGGDRSASSFLINTQLPKGAMLKAAIAYQKAVSVQNNNYELVFPDIRFN